jgi:hypothetical protein
MNLFSIITGIPDFPIYVQGNKGQKRLAYNTSPEQ